MFITAFPLVYMISLSFKDIGKILQNPSDFLPSWDEISGFETYRSVLRDESEGGYGFVAFIRNSATCARRRCVITVILGTLAAYAAARLNFFGKRQISTIIVLVYLFPAIVLAIPLFVVFSQARAARLARRPVDRLPRPDDPGGAVHAAHVLRDRAAREVEEAAMVDGCGRLTVIRRVTLPLSAPAIASVSLYVFMIAWNEFLFVFLFLQAERDQWTLPLGLQQLHTAEVAKTVLSPARSDLAAIIILFFSPSAS